MFTTPTIKDVAAAASVHFTTVSLALRGHPSIPAVTRDRIVAAAARIGYRKDKVFSALSSRRARNPVAIYTPRIAWVNNRSPENGYHRLPHLVRMEEAARRQAESMGYRFEALFLDEGHHTNESLTEYLRAQEIRGVIVAVFQPGRPDLKLPWDEFSVVKVESLHMPPALTSVSSDQGLGIRIAMESLHGLGYQRIGLAVGRQDEIVTGDINVSEYLYWNKEHGLPSVDPLLFPVGSDARQVVPIIKDWVRRERPDVVVCNWSNIRGMLNSAGFSVPEDIACACLCMERHTPSLAGVVTNLELVAEQATVFLAMQLRAERRGVPTAPSDTLVRGKWKAGASAPRKGEG